MPHDDGWHGARDQYGNPQEYLAALESEDRREWQKILRRA